jgi:ferredoxin
VTKAGWKTAREIRIVFSLTFLVFVTLIFLDPWHLIQNGVLSCFTAIEIVPALLKLIVAGSIVSTVGFGIIVLTTFLFGRAYCSAVCPVGTLQDISGHFAKKFNRRKRFKYFKSPQWLQYLILLVSTIPVLLGGSMILGDLLEPFSSYGRLMTNFALEPLLLSNNLLAALLTHFELYFLYDIPLHVAETGTLLFTFLFFATVIYLSATKGRFFCNSFCPAGAILSLISRVSVFKLVIRNDSCNDCGACDRVCKAECIDSVARRIDFSACVSCFDCLRVCPTNAIEYSMRPKRSFEHVEVRSIPADGVLQSRRELLLSVGIPAAALLLAPGIVESGLVSASMRQPVSPPGSLSIRRFTSICTACHLCVASCPTNVLRPSFLEYGIAGMSQPMMNYEAGYCNYDCVICGDVCPTGAILKRSVEEKKRIQIGKAKFKKDDCIVVSKKKDCAACSEHCPTKAVHTVPYEGNLLLPEVDDEICIGCGACEHVCPSIPGKAIFVNANIAHLKAKKPETQEVPKKTQGAINVFPF